MAAGIGLAAIAIGGKIIGGSSKMIGNMVANRKMKKQIEANEEYKKAAQEHLEYLKDNRQAVINPYGGITEMKMDNAYANLTVATEAAVFQAEEADIALANSLDTLRETGASAGGATALANAALRSKRGISASIETQESANAKLKAQGEMQAQTLTQAEKSRVQEAEAQGKAFVFNATENREAADIARAASEVDYYRNMENYYINAQIGQGARTAESTVQFAGQTTQYLAGAGQANTQGAQAFGNYAFGG